MVGVADELDRLLSLVEDQSVRQDLAKQINRLKKRRRFGLVFEQHLPEMVVLPQHGIRRGTKVVPIDDHDGNPSTVTQVSNSRATLQGDGEPHEADVDSLVAIAEFGDPIYPGLKRLESIDAGGEKPAHVVIKGENYHALEALQFTHSGKVDCIYIDPPYNTGNRDWKYNNNYVDKNDSFKHSKWLSFMERRLLIARRLLTDDGTLVVTIDEHEVENLGLLLRQTYPAAKVQLVTIVMNTAGSDSPGQFARADEYAYFCRFGKAAALPMPSDLLSGSPKAPQLWFPFHRSRGLNDRPSKRKNLVYPVGIDPETLKVMGTGPTLEERVSNGEVEDDPEVLDAWLPSPDETVDGYPAVWPLLEKDEMTVWQYNPDGLQELLDEQFFRVRTPRDEDAVRPFVFAYVKSGNQKKTLDGTFETVGHEPCGARIIKPIQQPKTVKTVWKVPEHDARLYGTTMLRTLVGTSGFTYPKSPYAVRDVLDTVVGDNPDAIIVDFFAGSGTTAQSTFMLNEMDDGNRTAILITNNEVDGPTQDSLKAKGFRQGDEGYESQGVFHSVTQPRIKAAVTGVGRNGKKIEGDYVNGEPIASGFKESVEFLELEYLDPAVVELGRAFDAIAPLLWMRAGSTGPVLGEEFDSAQRRKPYVMSEQYGVLFNPSCFRAFIDGLPATATHVFVVTDSRSEFSHVAGGLPPKVEPVQLYENYLTTFAINTGGAI